MTKLNNRPSSPKDILEKPYARKLTPDADGGYVAAIHEFPGLVAHGSSPNDALANLESAAESWLEAAIDTSFPVPEPANFESCSGKIALRISRRLHQLAAERAELEGTSLNQLISTSLAQYLGQQRGIEAAISAATDRINETCAQLRSSFVKSAGSNYFFVSLTPRETHFTTAERFIEAQPHHSFRIEDSTSLAKQITSLKHSMVHSNV